jgi:hypothetical protein
MFVIEIVKGKDNSKELGKPQCKELGKMIGSLFWMLCSVFNTGRYVVPDAGFCVLKALGELRQNGFFSSALI